MRSSSKPLPIAVNSSPDSARTNQNTQWECETAEAGPLTQPLSTSHKANNTLFWGASMKISRRNLIGAAVLSSSTSALAGCGTILYPERRGQSAGRLDPAVVILDGIGLLFFFVPGVIAFAVDFNNGTIYLPNSQSSDQASGVEQVQFNGTLTEAKLDSAWQETYGQPKPFAVGQLERRSLDDGEALGSLLRPRRGQA